MNNKFKIRAKKIRNNVRKNKGLILQYIVAGIMTYSSAVSADAGVGNLQALMNETIVPWIQAIGAVVAFIGAIMFALAWKNDDADAKVRGTNTFASGFMTAAIATGLDKFFSYVVK